SPHASRRPRWCFYHGHDLHRTLHSFPTRRSSDLARPLAEGPPMKAGCWFDAKDGRIREVPEPRLLNPRDAIVRPRCATTRTPTRDRKSTRLNSSHVKISYAVFCLKKKRTKTTTYL